MLKVWIDWGSGRRDEVQCYRFDTLAELNNFLEGIEAAAAAWGIEDYRQFNNEEELAEAELIDN